MIFFKSNVRLKRYTPSIRLILEILDNINREKIPNYPEDWTITSINDSTHMKNSKHYLDEAIDMRSKNFENETRKHEFKDRIQFALGPRFTVLYENAGTDNQHFHIQVKKGQAFK
jgi:hypothetical protein